MLDNVKGFFWCLYIAIFGVQLYQKKFYLKFKFNSAFLLYLAIICVHRVDTARAEGGQAVCIFGSEGASSPYLGKKWSSHWSKSPLLSSSLKNMGNICKHDTCPVEIPP